MINVEVGEECVRTYFVIAETQEEAQAKANAYYYTNHEEDHNLSDTCDLGELDKLDCFGVVEIN